MRAVDQELDRQRRRADQADEARFEYLLDWTATRCRTAEAAQVRELKRRHRRARATPAWKESRRHEQIAAAAQAAYTAGFYARLAGRLEEAALEGGNPTVGHRFTIKELRSIEAEAREAAPTAARSYLGGQDG